MLYARAHQPVVGGVAPARVVTAVPPDDRGPTWLVTDDPVLEGLWTVAAAERPELGAVLVGPGPLPAASPPFERLLLRDGGWAAERWDRVPAGLRSVPSIVASAPTGPWSAAVVGALPAGERGVRVVAVEPLPDRAVAELDPSAVRREVDLALARLDVLAPAVVVIPADALTGRPRSGPTAAVGRAVFRWAGARGARVIALGPLSPTDGAHPVLGVRPLGPAALRDGLRAALRGDEPVTLVVDAQWREVTRALPHLAPVASRLTRRTAAEVRDGLRAAAARILRVPVDRVAPERALRDLGFDSLQLEALRVAIRDELGVELGPTALLAHPSLESVARVVEAAG